MKKMATFLKTKFLHGWSWNYLNILTKNRTRIFWPISQEPEFGPYVKNQNFGRHGVCARKPITIWSFILDHFQPKLMTKFSEIWKKTHFWPILGPFCRFSGQWESFWKIRLSHAQLHVVFYHHAKNEKKLMIRFLENSRTEVRTYGSTDGQTLFHRTLPATAGVSIKNFDSLPTDWINWKIQFLFSDFD